LFFVGHQLFVGISNGLLNFYNTQLEIKSKKQIAKMIPIIINLHRLWYNLLLMSWLKMACYRIQKMNSEDKLYFVSILSEVTRKFLFQLNCHFVEFNSFLQKSSKWKVGEKLSQTAGGRTYGDPDTTLNF